MSSTQQYLAQIHENCSQFKKNYKKRKFKAAFSSTVVQLFNKWEQNKKHKHNEQYKARKVAIQVLIFCTTKTREFS